MANHLSGLRIRKMDPCILLHVLSKRLYLLNKEKEEGNTNTHFLAFRMKDIGLDLSKKVKQSNCQPGFN